MKIMICPKCQYERKAIDAQVMAEICPSCGIVYQKWLARQGLASDTTQANQFNQGDQANQFSQGDQANQGEDGNTDTTQLTIEPHYSFTQKIKNAIFYVPESVDSVSFWGRLIVFVLFFIWGWKFILGGISWLPIGSSFLHSVNLPFHEFGHILFLPFGEFMTIIGGSLFQVSMPLCIMIVFIVKGDNFAASMMLWWSGQNFIDVSPYIADAQERALPLLGGGFEAGHDWGDLLTMTGTLDKTWEYAHLSFNIGTILILISFIWSVYILYLQWQRVTPL